ncbi:MAG: mandelate racemase/muconate lactonizing enzyme family protein [Gemmobacter sp.]|nr:mandelate racemase/muconate lactonizing enzyme family protein [Gemmobacter sp.]
MKIKAFHVTPLHLPLKTPYIWSQGVEHAFHVNLIRMEAEDGTVGYGETTTAPDATAQARVLEKIGRRLIGTPVFDIAANWADAYRALFLTFGGNMPRYGNQLQSGIEMAALDLQGKLLGRPVWDLLGGQRRADVGYFYFLQGETPEEIAADAAHATAINEPVIYLKVGVGAAHDRQVVPLVRQAIGDTRLRLDANEAWDVSTAIRRITEFAPYGIEYIEQPTTSRSIEALRRVTERSPVAIGADQAVFTLDEVFRTCATGAADMIAVGPREVGGLRATLKAAAIAEGAGLNICIHSSMTTGITTCAEHHAARAIPNLDDGNQIMWQLLREDIVESPGLTPVRGRLALQGQPGLGFTLDDDAVARAAEAFRRQDWH